MTAGVEAALAVSAGFEVRREGATWFMFVLVPAVGVAETIGGAVAADEVLIGLEDTLLAACKAGFEIATAVVSPNTSVDPVDGGTSTVPLFRFRNTLAGGKAGRANLDLSGDGREYGVPQVSQSICRFFVIGVVVGVFLLLLAMTNGESELNGVSAGPEASREGPASDGPSILLEFSTTSPPPADLALPLGPPGGTFLFLPLFPTVPRTSVLVPADCPLSAAAASASVT